MYITKNMTNLKSIFIAACIAGLMHPASGQSVKSRVKPGNSVYELVYNGKNNSVYVATTRGNSNKAAIYQMDASNLAVKDSIVLETGAFGLGINEKTQTLYGTCTRGNAVIAVDLKTNKVVATIQNGQEQSHTREAVVDEKNNKVYVSDVRGGIWVIDGKSNTFSRMISAVGPSVTGLAVDSDRDRLYAISKGKVVFYDLKADAVIDSFPTGADKPINLAIDKKTNRLFISHQGSGSVSVLDAEKGTVIKAIETGEGALGIAYSPEKNYVYVANRGASTTTIIDARDYHVVASVESGSLPNTVVVDKKGNAYVTSRAQGAGRPKPGEKPKPSNDPNGDVVALIGF